MHVNQCVGQLSSSESSDVRAGWSFILTALHSPSRDDITLGFSCGISFSTSPANCSTSLGWYADTAASSSQSSRSLLLMILRINPKLKVVAHPLTFCHTGNYWLISWFEGSSQIPVIPTYPPKNTFETSQFILGHSSAQSAHVEGLETCRCQ